MKTEKLQELFNQIFKVQITSLVIYGLQGGHTQTYLQRSDFKKPSIGFMKILLNIKTKQHAYYCMCEEESALYNCQP